MNYAHEQFDILKERVSTIREEGTAKTALKGVFAAQQVLADVNKFMQDYKITPAVSIVTSLIKATSHTEKFAHLVALIDLYVQGNGHEVAMKVLGCLDYIVEFFALMFKAKEDPTVIDSIPDELADIQQQSLGSFSTSVGFNIATGQLQLSPESPLEYTGPFSSTGKGDSPSASSMMEEAKEFFFAHQKWIRPAVGILALCAASFGFQKLISFDWILKSHKTLGTMASSIKNRKVVMEEIDSATDTVFSMLFDMAGETYVPPRKQAALELSQKVQELDKACQQAITQIQHDVFGFKERISVDSLDQVHKQLEERYYRLTETDRTLYPYMTALQSIRSTLNAIRHQQRSLISMTGKQEPVRVWFYGKPGVGKTHCAEMLRDALGVTEYARDTTDQYWSNYHGQYICRYDDIAQRNDHADVMEWHTHSSSNATPVSGAAIETKGIPFSSKILVATSNHLDLKSSPAITDMGSFNRRRDVLIYTYNPEAVRHRHQVGQQMTPEQFAQCPTRFFLLKAEVAQGGDMTTPDDSTILNHPRVICELDLNLIVKIVQNMELRNRESFRLRLCKRQPELEKFITIPKESFSYSQQYTDFAFLSDTYQAAGNQLRQLRTSHPALAEAMAAHTKDPLEMMYGLTKLAASADVIDELPLEHAVASLFEDSMDSLVSQACNYQPNTTRPIDHRYATIISGPPGFGKTQILHSITRRNLANYSIYTPAEFAAADMAVLTAQQGIIAIDDFTLTEDTIMKFSLFLDAFYNGTTQCKFVIATCNGQLLKGEREQLIKRRSRFVVIKTTPRYTARSAWRKMKGQEVQPLWKFIQEVAPSELDKFVTATNSGHPAVEFDRTLSASGIEGYIIATMDDQPSATIVDHSEFIIPFPDNYDYLVKTTISVEELRQLNGIQAVYSMAHKISILDGQGNPRSFLELVPIATIALNLIQVDYINDKRSVTSIFNKREMRIESRDEITIVVVTPVDTYGFIQTKDHPMLMFQIDQGTKPPMTTLSPESVVIDGITYDDPASSAARVALTRLFNVSHESRVAGLPADDVSLERKLVLASPMGQAVTCLLDLFIAAVRVTSVVTLIASLGAHTKAEEEPEPDTTTTSEVITTESVQTEAATVTTTKLPQSHNGMPHKRAQAQKRNDTAPPALKTDLEAYKFKRPAYEMSGVKRLPTVQLQLESRPQDWTLVQHEDGSLGVVVADSIFYAATRSAGIVVCTIGAITDKWSIVDLKAISGTYTTPSGGKYDIQFKTTTKYDMPAYKKLIGRQLTVTNKGHNINSLIAFSFSTGVPFDASSSLLLPSASVELWNSTGIQAPAPLRQTLRVLFPHSYNRLRQEDLQPEAMVDQGNRQQAQAIISNSVYFLLDGAHHVHGIMLRDRVGITVAHCSPQAVVYDKRTGRTYAYKMLASDKQGDAMLFEIEDKTMASYPSIMHHVASEQDLSRMWYDLSHEIPVVLASPEQYGEKPTTTIVHTGMRPMTSVKVAAGASLIYSTYLQQLHVTTGVSKAGDCGSPLIVVNPQINHKWCGIHRAGNRQTSVGCVITQEWITRVLTQTQQTTLANEAYTQHIVGEHMVLFDEPLVDQATGLLQVGTCKKVYLPHETKLRRTGLVIQEMDICEPAILFHKDPRLDGERDLFVEGLKRYGEVTDGVIDRAEVADAMQEIGNDIANLLTSKRQEVRIFTKTEAINRPTYAEYPMGKPLDRSGSSGYPHLFTPYGKKGDFLEFNDKQQTWYFKKNVEAQRVSSKIDDVINKAKQDSIYIHPFVAYCKDEVVKLSKIYDVNSAKTRIFFSGTMEYLVAYRMYFGAAMQRVMENFGELPPKIGISADGIDWNNLAHRLTAKSQDNCIATDVKNYDSSIHRAFISSVPLVYDAIYNRCGNPAMDTAEATAIRANLHRSVESPYIIGKDKIYKLDQAMVSGCPGTAIENSFVIWALYYIVWRRLALRNDPNAANYRAFKDCVELAIYGDDNIASVKPGYAWFNFNSFKAEAATMGFTITDALKTEGDVPDYLPLEKLDFLQRGFSKIGSFWVGPLSLKSLGKALHWIHDGKPYTIKTEHVPSLGGEWPQATDTNLIAESIDAMWPEFALHGEQFYNEVVRNVCTQAGQLGIRTDPPTWKNALALKRLHV